MTMQEYFERLLASQIVEREKEAAARQAIAGRKPGPGQTVPFAVAETLVSAGAITEHQAKKVRRDKIDELLYGPYVIRDELGKGGMGQVFRAWHKYMRREDALKTIPSESLQGNPELLDRFLREVALLAQIRHPHVVMAHGADYDEKNERYYLAMELIRGLNLQDWVQERRQASRPLDLGEACRFTLHAALGLEEIHAKGIVHRDIKPGNLILAPDGLIKVLDMGMARGSTSKGDPTLTRGSRVFGTPMYMAPEQFEGARKTDQRSDIYSLGGVLFFLCTGMSMYGSRCGDNEWCYANAHLNVPAPALRIARPNAPEALEALYQKMVAKEPEQRFQAIGQVIDALKNLRRPKSPPRPSPSPSPPPAPPPPPKPQAKQADPDFEAVIDSILERKPSGFAESLGIRLVAIAPGKFGMGSTKEEIDAVMKRWPKANRDWFDAEQPNHQVRIAAGFALAAHQVTVGQFRRFVDDAEHKTDAEKDGKGGYGLDESGGLRKDPKFTWRNPGFEQTDDHPVVNVSWSDANAFCDWLTKKDGRKFTLPTEAQWEFACRAGTTSLYGDAGHDPEELAKIGNTADGTAKKKYAGWTTIESEDGYVFTASVGRFRANPWGLHDMIGNVWEWCLDEFDGEAYAARGPLTTDPVVSSPSAALRVVRGGSWFNYGASCRPAYRGRSAPASRDSILGFRIASVPSPPKTA